MPFDPSLPTNGSPDSSAEMRSQLTGLFDLIQAVPAGPQGPPGPAITSYVVDATNTINAGENASVTVGFEEPSVHFTFNIPRGADGATGPEGAPFTNFVAETTTLPAGSDATVTAFFDSPTFSVHLAFGIPRGADGAPGAPGEVSTGAMNSAISTAITGTAQNPSGVAAWSGAVSDPPTQAEVLAIGTKLEELLNALKRS